MLFVVAGCYFSSLYVRGDYLKLSTKGRYGLKAMLDLAFHYNDSPISLKVIAKRQHLSENYLEQLIAILRRAGLVNSVRGAQGGYMLSKPPEKIKVGEIIQALEGTLAPVDCVRENGNLKCEKFDQCVSRIVWIKIRESTSKLLNSMSLADICCEVNRTKKGG